jgi:AraC-like DNA-binding protein
MTTAGLENREHGVMGSVDTLVNRPAEPTFWRDETLPFVEARSIADGRKVHYGKHAHETFSIGIVTGGRCGYLNGRTQQRIGAGTVVLMNPGDVHACNPERGGPWSYRMLYFDVPWLSGIQQELGRQQVLSPVPDLPRHGHQGLARAAEFMRDNYARSLKLEEICAAADLSPSYLIRAFNRRYGLTPHAYLINCRIEFSRSQLRRGRPIAEVALAAGFADQAHLQRSFKRLVAATPGQYRA